MNDSGFEDKALIGRFIAVRERLAAAELMAGREPGEVQLVAVSKWHPASRLAVLARYMESQAAKPETKPDSLRDAKTNALHIIFSENYLQEALGKQDELAGAELSCRWHFSGHLQSNKARQAFGRFELLHTLDSLSLAQNLQKEFDKRLAASATAAPQRVLLQVNIGREAQKSGLMPEDLPEFIDRVRQLTGVAMQGLMCLPPIADEAEASRPYFAGLRQLRDKLESGCGLKLPLLSMGMSHDFEVAVQEGANLVRVGTDIFGPRT
ncbi:MAG: YggS family pyridoxal phosphate-dependent enzyme [Deltaproteobacteria bacterium]|jgi:pyridoxal phosphate enzyme (YggS family)|nr:YggS family pyridoxal phosphate-dependent enzyme [Deltaproteobacteria bacterium]